MTLKRKGTFLTKQRIMINSIETVCILLLLIVVILYITEGYHIVLCIGNLSPKKFCAICARFKWGLSKGNPTHAFFKETGEVLWVSEICRTDISHFLFCLPVCLSPWRSCSKCCLTSRYYLSLSVRVYLSTLSWCSGKGWPWTQSVLWCQECGQHNAVSFLSW